MRRSTNAKLLPILAMGVALAWTMYDSSPVFAQRSRSTSRGSISSRDTGASRIRGTASGASTSRSSFNSTGRSLGGGIPQGTRSLTPSVRNPAPRSRTIVPEIRKPAAQSKTIVPNLRNLPSARKELSANNRTGSPGYETAPSRRIVLPPRGREQPAIHSTPRTITKGNATDSKISSPSYRVYPLRENTASQNNLSSARAKAVSDPRARSAEWKALSERLKNLAAERQTRSSSANPLLRSQVEIPSSKEKDRLADLRKSSANRAGMTPLAKALSPPRAKAPPNNTTTSPKHQPRPSITPSVPSQPKSHPPHSGTTHPGVTPYHSIFKPLGDPSAHGKSGSRSSQHHGGSPHIGSYHGGVDHRGHGHGTPRHDYRMHGTLDRHSRYPGHYSYGRYGYGYRGSSFNVYFGSPLYNSNRYADGVLYDNMLPYYMPYAVPVPVPLTMPYVVEEVVAPAESVSPVAPNGSVIPAAGSAAEFQRQAEQAFQEHRYEDAARLSNHAIVEDNQNGKLHLFASQTFFALEDYASAAAAVQQAASLLERSEWGFVVENYQEFYRGEDYVTQMAKLDEYLVQNPKAAHVYFLRGYHFLFLGHKGAARDDLAQAVELESRDRLAGELLVMAGGTIAEAGSVAPPEAEIIPPPQAE